MKIYIMGSTGAGKSTLAKALSKKYNIDCYELDKLVYYKNNITKHRKDEEIANDFNKILKQDSFIIEDIGRERFKKGRDICDKIYYIKLNKARIYKQMISRWFKQLKGKEDYNVKPTIKNFFKNLKDVRLYSKLEKDIIKSLENNKEKVVFLYKRDVNKILKGDNIWKKKMK